MILILSTPLAIYSYNLNSGKLRILATGEGEYFGITWDNSSIFLSHSNIDNASLETENDYRNSNKGYIKMYSDNGSYVVTSGLAMPHQILMDSLNRLLSTNTGLNSIIVTDNANKKLFICKLNDIDCEVINGEKVGNHINSFYENNDHLFVVAHNNGRNSDVYELNLHSLDVIKIHHTQAEWAHNVWICEHGMLICDSKNGSLYEVYSGETVWKADESPIITRGLAATDDYIIVGRSEYGNRWSRKWSDGGLWILDRNSLKTIDIIKLPRTGCINELRLVGLNDSCHKAPVLDEDKLEYIVDISSFSNLWRNIKYFNYMIKSTSQDIKNRL